MDFQALGPFQAFDDEGEIDLGGPKQRLVLAILLSMRGSAVSTDALIEGVWMGRAPATARKTLQGYVHHLRTKIAGGLETNKAGYALEVPDWRVDERRFCADSAEARPLVASNPELASIRLSAALALWKGTPYADLDGAPVLLPEITRLNEIRVVALGDRIEADLELGRQDTLIAELESLTIDFPLQERFRRLHMLALYRAGRHGEALRSFARARDQFVEETGLEPSDDLRRLERQILDRDPDLDAVERRIPGTTQAVRGYELRDQVSVDESGTVYRGYQRSIGREVAIRVIGPDVANDRHFIANYEADVARVAKLEHPNIVYVHDTWREPGRAYQVMRWIEGVRLDRHLAEHRLDDWTALRMIEQVGGAVDAAHRSGVVHGQLCARAVVWSSQNDAYLTDFVVGRAAGTVDADQAAFICLAFHILFGTEPASTAELCELLASTIASRELRDAFESALAGPGDVRCEHLVRALRRALADDVVELADERRGQSRSEARSPYKGLRAFEATDAADFFGRDELVARLAQLISRRRLVAVVGPSGSGKSSLVNAGLVPRMTRECPWLLPAQMFPGAYPFESIERALRSVASADGPISERLLADSGGLSAVLDDLLPDDATELLLVIDQFEELFTTVPAETVRTLFLESLATAVTDPASRIRVVLTLRADFFDRPLRYAEFGALVEAGLMPVSMPDRVGLAALIEEPAVAVGVRLEPGLVPEMIRDVAEEPGGLPLLQYALTELFDRRTTDTLTLVEYRESGGVLGALATRAEALYAALSSAGQRAMQQAFLRMVAVGDGVEQVRRRVTRADLAALEVDPDALAEGLQRFGAYRLLTFDADPVSRAPTVEVSHESLLHEWSRLRRWIGDQRDQLVVRKRLNEAMSEWHDSAENRSYLLRGHRLNHFDGWAAETEMALNTRERAFLQASREHDEAQARSASTRRRRVVIGLLATAIVAIAFGVYGLVQRNEVSAKAFAAETSRLGSDAAFVAESDRQIALLMAVETYRRDPGFEGLSALERVLVDAGPYLGHLGAGVAYSDAQWLTRDRMIAVTDGQPRVQLLDAGTASIIELPIGVSPTRSGSERTILATSPAGLAVVAGDDGVVLVDAEDGSTEPLVAALGATALAVSDDGSTIAIGRADGTVQLFDRGERAVAASVLANPPRARDDVELPTGVTFEQESNDTLTGIQGLAFSRDGEHLVTSGGAFLRAWNSATLTPAGPEVLLAVGHDSFNLVATGADRFWLEDTDDLEVVAVGGSFVSRWRMPSGERLSLEATEFDVVDAAGGGVRTALLLADDGRVVAFRDGPERGLPTPTSGRTDVIFETQEAGVSRLTVDAQRSRLAVATNDGVVIASLDGTRLLARAVPIGSSDHPTLTHDGATLAAGLATDGLIDLTGEQPTPRAFDVGVEVAQTAGSPATYEFVTAGSSDMLLWTSSFMEMRNAYDIRTGEYVGLFWGPYIPAWSDDGRRVARRSDTTGGTRIDEPGSDGAGHHSATTMASADFDSTGERIVIVSDDDPSGVVVDLRSGDERAIPDAAGTIVSAVFTPDDEHVVTVSNGGDVTLIDARSLDVVRRLDAAGAAASSEAVRPPVIDEYAKMLFSATDGVARLWDVESGRQIGKPLPADSGGTPTGVADDETLRVVTPVAGNALIWNLSVDEWADRACTAAGRNMTDAEWAAFGPRDTDPRPTCPDLPRS